MEQPGSIPVPGSLVSRSAVTAATLVYSAPTPGCGSRYLDGRVAHEARVLSAFAAGERSPPGGRSGRRLLEAIRAAMAQAGYADPRATGFLAPLARAALIGGARSARAGAARTRGHPPLRQALETAGAGGPLGGRTRVRAGRRQGRHPARRDALRRRPDALAREYTRGFEVTRELARPALLSALSRADSVRVVRSSRRTWKSSLRSPMSRCRRRGIQRG
jgi:triphosphoribosyl-dephospho-CoA synthase